MYVRPHVGHFVEEFGGNNVPMSGSGVPVLGNRPVPYIGSATGAGNDPQILLKTRFLMSIVVMCAESRPIRGVRSLVELDE